MAGNKKVKRAKKHRPMTVLRNHGITLLNHHRTVKNMGIRISNITPLGHPAHADKIDQTFCPIEEMLAALEENGELPVNARGYPVMWDELTNEWIEFAGGLVSMEEMFARAALTHDWPPQVLGLAALGKKLDFGITVDERDVVSARSAVAWMRAAIADVTPSEWTALCDQQLALGAEK